MVANTESPTELIPGTGYHPGPSSSAQTGPATSNEATIILEARNLTIRYSDHPAINRVTLPVYEHRVTSIIGPSGCGKSTLLRHFNRMNEFSADVSTEGEVLFRGQNLYAPEVDPIEIRRRIGMVFQKPNPFPRSIFENITWGPLLHHLVARDDLPGLVERSLRQADLWDTVKDRLHESGQSLSGGQQQRLCIARTIAMQPEVILMDEPCSALDPAAITAIEDLIAALKIQYTIVIVTHNLQEAQRVSDYTAFLSSGALVEFGSTAQLFQQPCDTRTKAYISNGSG